MLPEPLISKRIVMASLANTSVCEIVGVRLNVPTPPEKEAGLPDGRLLT